MLLLNPSARREKAYADGNWDKVISIALKQLKSDPEDIKALNDLADAYYQKGMIDEAYETCRQINSSHPVSDFQRQFATLGLRYMRYHLVLGTILYKKGRYDEALQLLNHLKFLKGHLSDKFHLSAQIHLARGNVDQAVAEYEQMWKWRPDRTPKVLKNLGLLTTKHPRHAKAQRLYIEILKKSDQLNARVAQWEKSAQSGKADPSDLYRLGYYYQSEGKDQKAVELFLQYRQSRPDDPEIHWHLGDLYGERGEGVKAMQQYRRVVELSPEKLDMVVAKLDGLVRYANEREKPAIVCEVISLHLSTGKLKAVREKLEQLAPAVQVDRELRGKVAAMLVASLERYMETGELDAARTVQEQLLLLDPTNPGFQARLREMDELLGQKRIQEMEEILRMGLLAPHETTRVLFELGEAYRKRGEPDEKQLSVYQQLARSESPYQADALLRLGLIFLRKGLDDLAEGQFAKLQQMAIPNEKRAQCFYQIGLAYEGQDVLDRAREYYKKTLEIDATYQDVARRLEHFPRLTPSLASTQTVSQKDPTAVLQERYEAVTRIGTGGMGTVFRAVDRVLRRTVALKFMKEDFQRDPEAVARFIREAQAASNLRHPGIVAIYDIHVQEPIYIAMEYVEGGTLRDLLRQRNLPVEEIRAIALQLCDAFGYAHGNGVVHRDIKPDNILMASDGKVKIADFGLARVAEGSTAMTRTGTVMGTPKYMAPEQIQGKAADARTDIYAFGVMLYELLTGKVPFSDGDVAYRQIHEMPLSPRLLNADVPEQFDTVVMTCLQKKPEGRFPSMEEVGRALQGP
ncbi:MAG: protein kinase [Nitrospirota bacterium]